VEQGKSWKGRETSTRGNRGQSAGWSLVNGYIGDRGVLPGRYIESLFAHLTQWVSGGQIFNVLTTLILMGLVGKL